MMHMNYRLVEGGRAPTRGTGLAAGLDLYARIGDKITLFPGERRKIPVGVCVEIPPRHVGVIMGRSGLAAKVGIDMLGGVIDPDYTGEICAIVLNTGNQMWTVSDGDRVGQLLIIPCARVELQQVLEMAYTERGDRGFGSTDFFEDVPTEKMPVP